MFDTAQKLAEELTNANRKRSRFRRIPVRQGSKLEIIGKRIVRTEVEFVSAKLKVKQIVQQIAKCTKCGTDEREYDSCHFQKASVPAPPLAHSISTPSLIAQVMYQKFVMGMPFARQEKDWYRLGLVLPRADMANWSIRGCEEWLLPVYNRIQEQLLGCQVLHRDETRIQCNKEEGKKASSESFLWVMRSAESEEITAAYFYYSSKTGLALCRYAKRSKGKCNSVYVVRISPGRLNRYVQIPVLLSITNVQLLYH